MAQIDLKNATIKIRDGYAGPGGAFVTSAVGAIGATTLPLSGGVGAVANFDYFKVVGDPGEHKITAHTETLSNTTSITFTPPLTASVLSGAVVTLQPHQGEVNIGDGTLTYDEKKGYKYIRNRGVLDTVRQEEDQPVEVKMDLLWEFIKASTGDPPTIEDMLKQRGGASTWVSSSADPCEPYAVNIEIMYEPPCSGEDDEIILLNDFRYETFNHDLKAGTCSVTGKCNITEATVTRQAHVA